MPRCIKNVIWRIIGKTQDIVRSNNRVLLSTSDSEALPSGSVSWRTNRRVKKAMISLFKAKRCRLLPPRQTAGGEARCWLERSGNPVLSGIVFRSHYLSDPEYLVSSIQHLASIQQWQPTWAHLQKWLHQSYTKFGYIHIIFWVTAYLYMGIAFALSITVFL